MVIAFVCTSLFSAIAQLPGEKTAVTAPPEPTPLPGAPPRPSPSASPVVSSTAPMPVLPLPTPPEIIPPSKAGEKPSVRSEAPGEPQLPTVEPYQPALPLEEPVEKPPPLLKNFHMLLEGNSHFTADQIRAALADQLTAIEQSGVTPALADDAAFFLGLYYRKNGYSQAEVKWRIEKGNTLRLIVAEGPFTRLDNVTFVGNAHIPNATLYDYLTGATRERFPIKKQTLPYIESDINSGVERMRGLYRSEGYLDVAISAPEIVLRKDKTKADVVVNINEGVQYHFGKITFEGDIIFYPQRELLKEMEVFTSKPYTPVALTNLERKIVYFYRSRGYFKAQVTSESDLAHAVNGYVPVKFLVEAGNIYRFDGVTQSGLQRLRPSFLPNRFKKLEGQVYSAEKLEQYYRKVIGTGLFANLKLTQTPLPNNDVELHFDVEEAKAKELGFSVGYEKLEGAIFGTKYVDRDLFGNGRPLSIDAEVAQKLLRGEVLYTDPWILETDNTLRLRFFALTQDFDGYTKNETGFRPELSRKFGEHLDLAAFALTRAVNIQNKGIDQVDLGPTNYRADSFGISATYDRRDSVLNPRKGYILNGTGDFATNALGSSLEFLRGTFRASYYLPVGSSSLLALGVRGGVIAPLRGSAELPIDERFFNGGSNSVRSFMDRRLGPKDSHGFPEGGETFTVANVEFVTPIRDSFDLALFTDAGSTGRRLGSGLGQTGFAIGPGLRYRLPLGPVRLDYGWNPCRQPGQPSGAVHFSFGFAF